MKSLAESLPIAHSTFPGRLALWLAVVVVVASFFVSAGFREKHFQELDSYMAAEFFADPQASVVNYALFGYGVRRSAPGEGAITKALEAAPDIALRVVAGTAQFQRYQQRTEGGPKPRDPEEVRAFLLKTAAHEPRVASLGPHALYRLALFTGLSAAPMPSMLRDAAMLPLASTYSVGPGLIYSAVWRTGPSPAVFMSRATLVTVAVFHVTVLILLATLLRAGVPAGAAAIASVWLLFASTPFSYGFHLGSAVWMMAASAGLLLATASSNAPRERARRVALAMAGLVFFSYLTVVYYAAFLLVDAAERLAARRGKSVLSVVREGLADHWPAPIGILICAVLFYEPGQGVRGGMASADELWTYLTYITLNLFGIAWGEPPAAGSPVLLAQVLADWLLLGFGARAAWRSARGEGSVQPFLARMLGALFVVYAIMTVVGLLAPAPTRHMLFLAPALFLLAGFGLAPVGATLGSQVGLARAAPLPAAALLAVLAGVGFVAQQARFGEVRAAGLDVRPARPLAGIVGDSPLVGWRLGLSHLRIADLRSLRGTVLYADSACDLACFMRLHGADPAFEVKAVTALKTYSTEAKMVAFVPPIDEARFPFDRRNRVFLARIEIAPRGDADGR